MADYSKQVKNILSAHGCYIVGHVVVRKPDYLRRHAVVGTVRFFVLGVKQLRVSTKDITQKILLTITTASPFC